MAFVSLQYAFPKLEVPVVSLQYAFPKSEVAIVSLQYAFPKLEVAVVSLQYTFPKSEVAIVSLQYAFPKSEVAVVIKKQPFPPSQPFPEAPAMTFQRPISALTPSRWPLGSCQVVKKRHQPPLRPKVVLVALTITQNRELPAVDDPSSEPPWEVAEPSEKSLSCSPSGASLPAQDQYGRKSSPRMIAPNFFGSLKCSATSHVMALSPFIPSFKGWLALAIGAGCAVCVPPLIPAYDGPDAGPFQWVAATMLAVVTLALCWRAVRSARVVDRVAAVLALGVAVWMFYVFIRRVA